MGEETAPDASNGKTPITEYIPILFNRSFLIYISLDLTLKYNCDLDTAELVSEIVSTKLQSLGKNIEKCHNRYFYFFFLMRSN